VRLWRRAARQGRNIGAPTARPCSLELGEDIVQRNAITIAAAALAIFVTLPTTARARPPIIVSDGRAAYLPVAPCRLADTRAQLQARAERAEAQLDAVLATRTRDTVPPTGDTVATTEA